jgi:hypothetical protein
MNINKNHNQPNFKALKVKLNKQSPTVQKYLSTSSNSLKDIEVTQQNIDKYITNIEKNVIQHAIRSYIANKFPEIDLKTFDEQRIDFFKDEPTLLVDLKERIEENYSPRSLRYERVKTIDKQKFLDLYIAYNNKSIRADSAPMENRFEPAAQLDLAMGYIVNSWSSNMGQAHNFFKEILENRPEFVAFKEKNDRIKAEKEAELLKKVTDWFKK